jgi:hypothetical protein
LQDRQEVQGGELVINHAKAISLMQLKIWDDKCSLFVL